MHQPMAIFYLEFYCQRLGLGPTMQDYLDTFRWM